MYIGCCLFSLAVLDDFRWRFLQNMDSAKRAPLCHPPTPALYCHPPTRRPREDVQVVMFVPTPVQWGARRAFVTRQFLREGWNRSQAVLLYVLGTRTGDRLEYAIDTSGVQRAPGVDYLFSGCRDFGDERQNPNGTSSTTCKVYEACAHIARRFRADYVWRGADDTYVNLQLFFREMMAFLPRSRLYMGGLRRADTVVEDLQLSRSPALQRLFGLLQYGEYMAGLGYVLSGDVAEFIGTFRIPPHQTWCEDVMVGMWLNPFQITKIHVPDIPGYTIGGFNDELDPTKKVLGVHYMKPEWWDLIDKNGDIHF